MRCQGCSKGCIARLTPLETGISVEGCLCKQGIDYVIAASKNESVLYKYNLPIKNGYMKHILIISDIPVEPIYFEQLDDLLCQLSLEAPIVKNEVILMNPLGLNINLVAARSLKRRV